MRQTPAITVLRLYLLRGCYLLLVVGLSLTKWPLIVFGAASLPLMNGVVNSLLGALGLLAILGLFAPLRMLPLLLFEVAWKLIWTVSVALPLWLGHAFTAEAGSVLFACAFAVPFLFIIPWRYVFDHYVRSPEPRRGHVAGAATPDGGAPAGRHPKIGSWKARSANPASTRNSPPAGDRSRIQG